MKLLLDPHALLWWWTDDPKLSPAARQAIADENNEIQVSAASAWEIATKYRLGKLPHAPQARDRFNELVAADGFEYLPISCLHSLKAGTYPSEHRVHLTVCWPLRPNWNKRCWSRSIRFLRDFSVGYCGHWGARHLGISFLSRERKEGRPDPVGSVHGFCLLPDFVLPNNLGWTPN